MPFFHRTLAVILVRLECLVVLSPQCANSKHQGCPSSANTVKLFSIACLCFLTRYTKIKMVYVRKQFIVSPLNANLSTRVCMILTPSTHFVIIAKTCDFKNSVRLGCSSCLSCNTDYRAEGNHSFFLRFETEVLKEVLEAKL